MQTLQPQQAEFLLQFVLPTLRNEHRITKSVIEAIPLNKSDYRPNEISKPALELAWHTASAETWFLDGVASGAFNYSSGSRPESIRNSADLAAWYAEAFEKNFERVSKLKGEQLVKVIDFRGVFQLPAVAYINFALSHSVHHRGQLSMYLRPMGAKVPAMYGESYDSAEARKAKASST